MKKTLTQVLGDVDQNHQRFSLPPLFGSLRLASDDGQSLSWKSPFPCSCVAEKGTLCPSLHNT